MHLSVRQVRLVQGTFWRVSSFFKRRGPAAVRSWDLTDERFHICRTDECFSDCSFRSLESLMWSRLLGVVVALALVSQVLTLLIAGHSAYLWVQGLQAIAGSFVLLIVGLRYRRHDPRANRWPPFLPLAAIALSGGVKDIYVAVGSPTPWWLIVVLLGAVVWFILESWT